jgi:ribosomal protein L29
MTLPKYKNLDAFVNLEAIEKEIFIFQKNLFDLRMKRSVNQKIKSHLFTHYKRQIAQLQFKKFSLSKIKK